MTPPVEFTFADHDLLYRQTSRTFIPLVNTIDESTEFTRKEEREQGLPELPFRYSAVYVFRDKQAGGDLPLIQAHAASHGWTLSVCYFRPIDADTGRMYYWFYI